MEATSGYIIGNSGKKVLTFEPCEVFLSLEGFLALQTFV